MSTWHNHRTPIPASGFIGEFRITSLRTLEYNGARQRDPCLEFVCKIAYEPQELHSIHSQKSERKYELMKSKVMLTLTALMVLLSSACGAKAVPTVAPSQVQASIVAMANTMVAITQAAMPTKTPVPPTDTPTVTPQPAATIPPLPTVAASPTVVASVNSGSSGMQRPYRCQQGRTFA